MLGKLLRRREAAQDAPRSDAAVAKEFALDVPDVGFVRARQQFYEAFGTPVVDRARYFVICIALTLIVVVLLFTIQSLYPLKTIQPWVVKVDDARGTVVLDKGAATPAAEYKPGRPVLERELFQFVHQLWSINSAYISMTKEGHAEAFSRTRERAVQEFREFIDREKVYSRVKTEVGLVRSVERRAVAFRSEEGIAHVSFRTTERTRDNPEGKVREWVMLVQYAQRPVTAAEEVEKNPLGLYITHFEFNEER